MELNTQRLVLREFSVSDFDAVWDYESNPETQRYERGIPTQAMVRETLQNIERWAQDNPRTRYLLAVTLRPEPRAVGLISLSRLHSDIREWEMGWVIHPAHWGNGYATEAARLVRDFAFDDLHVHRIVAFCHVLNDASVRIMEKLGMQCEGRLRQVRWWNESWADEFVYAMLEDDRRPEQDGLSTTPIA